MYPEGFQKGMVLAFQWEGGYVNDPQDPGGETKYGISKRFHPNVNIKALTPDQATQIYYNEYWLPYPQLADIQDTDFAARVFLFGINAGMRRAVETYMAHKSLTEFRQAMKNYYQYLADARPSLKRFLHGWFNRANA